MMKLRLHEKYLWTHHAHEKMRYYRLAESRIKRIIRHPTRVEEGILEDAVACMQPVHGEGGKSYSEIWTMYLLVGRQRNSRAKQIKIITAWRYPGRSPERDPVPAYVLHEIKSLI